MGISQADIDALLTAAEGLAAEAGPEPDTTAAQAMSPPPPPDPARPAAPHSAGTYRRADLQRILSLAVPVMVNLAEQDMPVRKVLEFKPGSIIEFEQPFDADLALVVANRRIGMGQAVKVGENFGLRITQIGDIDETIQALGGE